MEDNAKSFSKDDYAKRVGQDDGAAKAQYGDLDDVGRAADLKRIAQMSAQTVAYSSQAELQSIMPLGLVVRSSMPWMDQWCLNLVRR